MDGPGNFAIDDAGSLWVTDNYTFSPDPRRGGVWQQALSSSRPTAGTSRSPYRGGGLNGAGYGITLDPRATSGSATSASRRRAMSGGPAARQQRLEVQARRNRPVTRDTGFTQGGVDWPQGTVSDREGNIWIANCGNGTVTRYPGGDPKAAAEFWPTRVRDQSECPGRSTSPSTARAGRS